MKPEVVKNQPVDVGRKHKQGRGRVQFPEFLQLAISKDRSKADCLIYPDTPDNRKKLIQAKCNYNRNTSGAFADYYFVHRYETRHGEPVIVIQRIK